MLNADSLPPCSLLPKNPERQYLTEVQTAVVMSDIAYAFKARGIPPNTPGLFHCRVELLTTIVIAVMSNASGHSITPSNRVCRM
ncbi:MAG: hypothetical protein F6K37_40465 [Moorea sp. SIO4E2]|uniref:hypothetical protein n=1 Tax=Moorena sp. SIO4E2 TaxID=2607826 RepID=UPI0013BC4B3E|nr:hypothetical protein [Moorena sp. SIO4E2]NEQ11913.1 hypothetical protein [Moorena sp. SIO4E2]